MSNDYEEILKKLKSMGMDPDNPQWVQNRNVDFGKLGALERQRELLRLLEQVLETQVRSDMSQLEAANMKLARLRRGGGQ